MTHWFVPYRYLDPELRERAAFESLDAIARDIHAWRRTEKASAVRVTEYQSAWENPEGSVAALYVEILAAPGGAVLGKRLILTAGEGVEDVRSVLIHLSPNRKAA